MGWTLVNICDLCDSVSATYSSGADMVTLVNTSDVLDGKFLNTNKVLNKNLKGQFKKTFQKGDILYSEIRPINKHFAYVDFDATDHIASTKLMVLRAKPNVNSLFLYHILKNKSTLVQLQALAEARSGTFPQITYSEMANVHCFLPDRATQDRIVAILSSLDDKIELNRRINANLEQQAQALYKSWFGEISSNITLQEITLNITDGVHNTVKDDCSGEYLLLSCKNIVGGHLVIGSNERRINKETFDKLRKRTRLSEGDILVSTVGTVGEIVILLDPPANVEFQRSVGIIKPNISKASPYYIYCALKDKQEALKHTAHGAVQQCIFIGDLKNFEIPYSYSKKLIEFDTIVSPMFNQLTINHRESNYLTQLRDTLLPKLMSGEITV